MSALAAAVPKSAPHFLILDDDLLDQEFIETILQEAFPEGRVKVTANPLDALHVCRNEAVACVLMDFNMPEINGLEFGEQLRGEFPYLAMVLLTSVGDEMLAAGALRGGFSDYIPKGRITKNGIRRTIERAVTAAEQARVIANQQQELEHFAYALAHDFKQPIRQIRTFAQLITEELGPQERHVSRNLAFLNDAARRLGALVDVMSQYTLLNAPPELGPVDLGTVVLGVRAVLEPLLKERNGVFVADASAELLGSEPLLLQTLQNLVINGLRYNESERPTVVLKVRPGGDDTLRLLVEDNGIGIEPQYLSEIFAPLVRLHAASKYPGTGLGLTIARKAVTAQGGRLWCESRWGVGSTFFVELRRWRGDAQGADIDRKD